MAVLEKDVQVNFKTNSTVWSEAKKVFEEKNIDATTGFNLFLQFVANRKALPFLTDDELERERLVAGLQERVAKNIQEIKSGKYVTLEEMESELLG